MAGYGAEGAVEVDSVLVSSGGRGVGLASGSSTLGCSAGGVQVLGRLQRLMNREFSRDFSQLRNVGPIG